MKRLIIVICALTLFVPALALAQSVFNGTWKLDPTTVHSVGGKPILITLKNGMFSRSNARPLFKVKADGKYHTVTGHKYFDAVAISVINNHTIRETDKEDGKVVAVKTISAAPNGKTATLKIRSQIRFGPRTVTEVLARVGMGKLGSNVATGSWRPDHVVNASSKAYIPTFKIVGDTVTFGDGAGDAFTAKLGGKPVPFMVNGHAAGMVSVGMLGKNTLHVIHTKKGKVTMINNMTISADGKTMMMVVHYIKSGRTLTMMHYKQ